MSVAEVSLLRWMCGNTDEIGLEMTTLERVGLAPIVEKDGGN